MIIGVASGEEEDDVPLAPVKRLGLNGASSGRYFEYPQITTAKNDSLFCDQAFTQKVISKLEACIGVGIYSIKLTYADGTESPMFGCRQTNAENSVKVDQATQQPCHIHGIRIQAWSQNYVQALTFLGEEAAGGGGPEELAALAASKGKGETLVFNVEPG